MPVADTVAVKIETAEAMTASRQYLPASRRGIFVLLLAVTVFLLECAAGYYFNVYVGYFHSDGISRVANAFYVLYSRNPHLGAIGFVWNPLPSLVDLLFLLLYPLFPAMATKGIAGLLMSATFAALTAGVTAQSFIRRNLPWWSAAVFVLLFSLNPMIFLFGFNGMSDAPFMFFVILSVLRFLDWVDKRQTGDLVIAGFSLALSFWCRYEAVPFGFSLIMGAALAAFMCGRCKYPASEGAFLYKWSRVEGVLPIIATPLVYSIILWVLLNAVIMNNPFYFMNGEYSNTSQIQGHLNDAVFAVLLNNPVNAFGYAMKKVAVFSVPAIAVLIVRLLNRRLFQWDTLVLAAMILSIPTLQVYMLIKGSTLAWLRYFVYVFPVSFAWLPYELSKTKRRWQTVIPLLAMTANFGILSYVITQPAIAPDENTFLQNSLGKHNQTYYEQRQCVEIAGYLDEKYPHSNILVDSFSAYLIILESCYPQRFYISSDFDFKKAISNPQSYGVDYILIPRPESAAVTSAINSAYPNLFEHGAEWAKLERDFGSQWRLYKVTRSTGG